MARSEIPMVINLRQNKNDDSTAYGKYFAEVDSKEPLNLKGFAAHMTSHGKIADYQMCVLVLGQVVDCMKDVLWSQEDQCSLSRNQELLFCL